MPQISFKKAEIFKKWLFTNYIYAPQRMNPPLFNHLLMGSAKEVFNILVPEAPECAQQNTCAIGLVGLFVASDFHAIPTRLNAVGQEAIVVSVIHNLRRLSKASPDILL